MEQRIGYVRVFVFGIVASLLLPAVVMAEDLPANASASQYGQRMHAVNLNPDGFLAGKVETFDAAGVAQPVRADVSFVQNGKVISSVRTDEWGHFQAPGLAPGVYSVVAVSEDGIGVLSAVVLPFNEAATIEQMSLDMTIVLATEIDAFVPMRPAAAVTNPAAPTSNSGYRGGGGGGGGMAALLGLGGLAGLAGLGGGGESLPPASPNTP